MTDEVAFFIAFFWAQTDYMTRTDARVHSPLTETLPLGGDNNQTPGSLHGSQTTHQDQYLYGGELYLVESVSRCENQFQWD